MKQTDKLNIFSYLYFYNGAGVAAGDVDNDGKADLFFVSNQGKNKLYLNQGGLKFKDISKSAGIEGFSDWKTGVTMADINGDGWLDIYICAVANYRGLEGSNELYINNGPDSRGQISFTEKAAEYGLDFTGFATQAAFFDYDHDGDLDCYLLNHAVHTTASYNKVTARILRNNEAGDYLMENQLISTNNPRGKAGVAKFRDVSKEAGIYGAAMGYGLGIVISDLNNDGWDDIYVSNDFHEDDYYYINNHDGTFTESVKEHFTHLSRFSMGCDAADINNDGFPDLMTLDMYPEDEIIEKSSLGEDPLDIYLYKLQFGYYYQYSRNCLQLSLSGQKFSDIGLMAGVAATDWSWAPLMADFNNDGNKDIFISNGIVKRPNNLDYIKYASQDSIYYAPGVPPQLKQNGLKMMPDGEVHKYMFEGTGGLRFEDRSLTWGFAEPDLASGAVYADLDNDGDLDIITNNINEPATIYRNGSESLLKNHYLKIELKGGRLNTAGFGAKVFLISRGRLQMQEMNPTRGFLSSVEPVLTFGLGKTKTIDTVMVIWDNGKAEVRTGVAADRRIELRQENATLSARAILDQIFAPNKKLFREVTDNLSIPYKHQENDYLDFYRESLIPFQTSTEGPKIAVGDVNQDGLEDFFVGGAKWQKGKLFLQGRNGEFAGTVQPALAADSIYEDVDAVFFDADNDKDLDLYVVSGGNEFSGKMPEQFDRLYLNDGKGKFSRSTGLPPMYANKSCVRPCDFDGDGDLDLFVGGRVLPYKYGESPNSYLLLNDGKGHFTDRTRDLAPALQKTGMVTDAKWFDSDGDGDMDLMVAGDWMPVRLFENQAKKLVETTAKTGLARFTGLWQTINTGDFDHDGDVDVIAGNLGTNTKFKKKGSAGLLMYVKDIDGNGTMDQILAYKRNDKWYPVASKDELGKQLPFLNKRFVSYRDYAGKTVEEIFSDGELRDAKRMEVNTFESVYFENKGNNSFQMHRLPDLAQVSKLFSFDVQDFDGDGNMDILTGGNLYGVSTYQGRYDASYGLMLKGSGKGTFTPRLPTDCGFLVNGQVRDIKSLKTTTGYLILVARNNASLQIFKAGPNGTSDAGRILAKRIK